MLTAFQAIILGAVQGITEFLPISSSAHLILLPWFFHFKDPGLTFDVILHLATALALVSYFWKDLWALLLAFLHTLRTRKLRTFEEKLSWFILFGSLPAALAGIQFQDLIENAFRSPLLIAGTLILFALILWLAEYFGKKKKGLEKIGWGEVLIIGLAQVLALVPGVSRAGITMTAGLFCGLKREGAARFSFLLATPIILAAGLLKLKTLCAAPQALSSAPLWLGFLSATLFGFLSIKFLLDFLKEHSFHGFVWYRIILGIVIIVLFILK
jgi:undecaprenyl-diphosphatase